MILDEPCQGLDHASTEKINNLVDTVCGDKMKTLIYVTHQREYVPSVLNRHLNLKKAPATN